MKHLRYFPTLNGYINAKAEQKLNYPSVSVVNDDGTISVMIDKEGPTPTPTPTPEPHDYSQDYLTFEAIESGTFSFTNDISYSIDSGTTWTILSAGNASPSIAAGSEIMWKGNLEAEYEYGIGNFNTTGNFNVYGNIMSLLYNDDFIGQTDLTNTGDYAFASLFGGTDIINTHNLILPVTTLTNYCYVNMFNGCTSLTTAPELPATTLAQGCYDGMFYSCTSLATAPELPATTLAEGCYESMFDGCKKLNYIKAMFTTEPSTTYTDSWVSDVSPTGIFIKNTEATWDVIGNNGVPSGWLINKPIA